MTEINFDKRLIEIAIKHSQERMQYEYDRFKLKDGYVMIGLKLDAWLL